MMGRAAAFLFGLLLTFDFALPVGANVRTADLLSALGLGVFCWSVLAGGRIDRAALALGVLLLVSVEWVAAEVWVSGLRVVDPKVQVVLLRWLLGAFAAYSLYRLSGAARTRGVVFVGAVAGALASLATVAYDWQTFDLTREMPTLGLEGLVFIDGVYRASGMFTHPNEAAGVVLVGAPVLIGLVEERRLPRLWLLLVVAMAVAVFWLTKSRSQVVVVMVLLGLWALRNAPRVLVAGLAAGAVAGLAALLDMLPGISDDAATGRLVDANFGGNFADRLYTITQSFDIALQHPFGVGSIYVDLLNNETGFTATHNALLQLAMMGGLPLLLLVLGGLVGAAWLLVARVPWRVEGWLALYLLCIFNVENYFFVSSMSILTQFLVAAAWCRRAAPVTSAAVPTPPEAPRLAAPQRLRALPGRQRRAPSPALLP